MMDVYALFHGLAVKLAAIEGVPSISAGLSPMGEGSSYILNAAGVVVVDVRYDVDASCQRIGGWLIASHELEVAAERLECEVISRGRVFEDVVGSDVEVMPIALLEYDR